MWWFGGGDENTHSLSHDSLWKKTEEKLHCDSLVQLHLNQSEKLGMSEIHISRTHMAIEQILTLHVAKSTLEIRKA